MDDRLRKLQSANTLFQAFDLRRSRLGNHNHATGKGAYLATPILVCAGVIGYLQDFDNGQTEGKVFLDAGSGSGEVVAVADIFGYQALGIEWDQDRVREANSALTSGKRQGFITSDARTVQGDFLDDAAYARLGISFGDVDYFFHAMGSADIDALVGRIASEAKAGARLALLGGDMLEDVAQGYEMGSLRLREVQRIPVQAVLNNVALYEKA